MILKQLLKTGYSVLIVIGLSIVVGLAMAFPVMWLWNWILPSVTNGMVGKLTVLQSWGLNILCGILFGGKSETKE